MQQTLRKVAVTVLQTGDELLPKTNCETNKNLASRSVDALAMLGHANAELSRLRREQIQFALRPEFASISKADIPNWPLLFGDDLPKQLKEAKQLNTVGHRLTNPRKKRRISHKLIQESERGFLERPKLPLQTEKTYNGQQEEMIQCLEAPSENVSAFPKFIPNLVAYLRSQCQSFQGGQVSQYLHEWAQLTSDKRD